jgi:hypothetical protein
MKVWLEAAGRGAVLAFGAMYVTYLAGILEAPTQRDALGLALAALGASVVAGLSVVKQALPAFSWGSVLGRWLSPAWVGRVDIFTMTAVGTLIASTTDIIQQSPDLSTWPALFTAALTGALAAGFRTVVGAGTKGESPAPGSGISPRVATDPPAE